MQHNRRHLLTLWNAPLQSTPVVDGWRLTVHAPRGQTHRAHWAQTASVPPHFPSGANFGCQQGTHQPRVHHELPPIFEEVLNTSGLVTDKPCHHQSSPRALENSPLD